MKRATLLATMFLTSACAPAAEKLPAYATVQEKTDAPSFAQSEEAALAVLQNNPFTVQYVLEQAGNADSIPLKAPLLRIHRELHNERAGVLLIDTCSYEVPQGSFPKARTKLMQHHRAIGTLFQSGALDRTLHADSICESVRLGAQRAGALYHVTKLEEGVAQIIATFPTSDSTTAAYVRTDQSALKASSLTTPVR